MGNIMTSMWTAVAGLQTNQSALNTSAHNVMNANTEGYVRQQSMTVDSHYNKITTNNQDFVIGTGTAVNSIRQIRNQFYDERYRQEVGREGFYQAQYETIMEIEDLFGEVNGVEYQTTISDLWESMQELAKSPDSLVVRSTVVNAASDFLTRSKDIYNQLCAYQEDLNTKIINNVNEINDLGNKIYDLNIKISNIEVAGIENANDLRDQRNLYLDELANLIDISYREEVNGAVTVIAEGCNFITSMGVKEMGLRKASDTSDLVIPYWPDYKEDVYSQDDFANITQKTDKGYLKGLLMARGDRITNVTDIPVEPVESDYTSTAAYNNAMNRYLTATREYMNTIDTSSMMTVMAQFDRLVSGIVKSIDNVLSPNTTMDILVDDGNGGYISKTITVLDEENAPVGMDQDTTMGESLFERAGVDRYKTVTVNVYARDENGSVKKDNNGNPIIETRKVRQYTEEDENNKATLYTINELNVNKEIIRNYSKLPLSTLENNGEYGYKSVVVDLVNVWDEEFAKISPDTMTKYTFQDYYKAMIDDIGNVGLTMKMMMESQQSMVDSAADTRDNYMGVSTDEELSSLMKAQNAYNASSRFFNVVNSMLETLVLGLGN